MKKLLWLVLALGLTVNAWAADAVYRGDSKDAKDVVAYYKGGAFFKDEACKELIFHHPGNMVAKEKPATPQNAVFRLMSDKLFKGFSIDKKDCLATIFVTKSVKGDVAEAKIYQGWAMPRDIERDSPESGVEVVTSFNITRDGKMPEDGMEPEPVDVLFTIKDNKVYKGDDTKECVLTLSTAFNSSRLLFICMQFCANAAK